MALSRSSTGIKLRELRPNKARKDAFALAKAMVILMLEKLTDIITAQLGCDADLIDENSALFEDLGADSLDLVEILMAVEESFRISIPDEQMPELRTVAEIISYVEANTAS